MHSTKQRRVSLNRIFGGFLPAAENKRRSSRRRRSYHHFVELEARVLMAGNASQLLFVMQPSQVAALSPMYPSITVKIADATGLQTTDTSKVTLRITHGPFGATLSNASAVTVTAVSGLATFDGLNLSLPGTYTLIASDGSLATATSTSFLVTKAANILNFQHPISNTTADGSFSTKIEIDDSSGLGHTVTTDRSTVTLSVFSGPAGAATLFGNVTASAVNGVVTFDGLTFPTAGTYRLVATDGGLITATSNSFVVSAGAPQAWNFAPAPSSTPVNGTIPSFSVNLIDSFGNIVTTDNSAVTLSISNGPTTSHLSGTVAVAAVNGVATFNDIAIDTAGAYTLHITNGTFSGDSDSFNITGAADHLAFIVQPAQTTAKQIITPGIQVAVEDALGHIIVADTSNVTIALTAGAGTLSGTTTVSAVNGIATFPDLSINAAGTAQLSASVSLLTGATSTTFTLTPAPVALTFGQGPFQVAMNSPMFPGISINVLDENGLTVVNDTSTVTLIVIGAPKGGSMTGTLSVDAVAGVATFDDLTFTKQGTYTLLAYDGTLVTETSVDFVVTAPAAKLTFTTQPTSSSMAGVTLPAFVLHVTDASGNLVTTDQSNVTIAITGPAGATVGGTTTVTAIGGVASFNDIVLTVAGKYTFTVSDGSLTGATSTSVLITPNTAPIFQNPNDTTSLLISPVMIVATDPTATLVGNKVNVLVGKTYPTLTVREQDMYGNLITTLNNGSAHVYILSGPQMTLAGTATAKFVKGIATFKGLTINTAGDYTLRIQDDVIVPHTTPYEVTATYNQMTTITPVVNSMRAPTHAANYAFGSTINLTGSIGSLVASNGIPYTNGTVGESVRLVTINGTTLETGTVTANGNVSFSFNDLAPGIYNVQAIYDGDTNHTGARSPIFTFKVGGTSTSLNVFVTPTTINSAATITLTASVTNLAANALVTSGTIQFFEDGSNTALATVAITGNAHTAVFTFIPTTGVHSYVAKFVANSSLMASTSVTKLATVV